MTHYIILMRKEVYLLIWVIVVTHTYAHNRAHNCTNMKFACVYGYVRECVLLIYTQEIRKKKVDRTYCL